MILILKPHTEQQKINELLDKLKSMGFSHHLSQGVETTIVGVIGDTTKLDVNDMRNFDIVADVKRISEPYKAVNRKFNPNDTIININGAKIGGGYVNVIAGPCSVETEEQIISIARDVKKSGAKFLRGGAFKPRTSPYSFQGLKEEGLRLLTEAKKVTGLPIVTELMNINHLEQFSDVDIIQVGARNMQNFEMLKELGHCKKPILLKRGLANTVEELLMSAEYIMSGGNDKIILCERGIRTFETYTRNTLDLAAVPVLKHLTHLPVIVDPSHATGIPWLVKPISKAAVTIGADGVMVEVHNNPKAAFCDGAQAITPLEFNDIMKDVKKLIEFEHKKMED